MAKKTAIISKKNAKMPTHAGPTKFMNKSGAKLGKGKAC